jgi:hypothetical protein
MKRLVLVAALAAAPLAATAMLGGCEEGGSSQKMNNPFKKAALAAAAPAKANYFEVKKNGKSYVLASPDSLKALNEGRESSLPLKEMPGFGPKGGTVVFENSGYNDSNRLVTEYKKNHNLP